MRIGEIAYRLAPKFEPTARSSIHLSVKASGGGWRLTANDNASALLEQRAYLILSGCGSRRRQRGDSGMPRPATNRATGRRTSIPGGTYIRILPRPPGTAIPIGMPMGACTCTIIGFLRRRHEAEGALSQAGPLHEDEHQAVTRQVLPLILGSSPILEGIPAFLAASRFGLAQLVVIGIERQWQQRLAGLRARNSEVSRAAEN